MKKYVEYTDGETGITIDILCNFKDGNVEVLQAIHSEDDVLPLLNEDIIIKMELFACDIFTALQ